MHRKSAVFLFSAAEKLPFCKTSARNTSTYYKIPISCARSLSSHPTIDHLFIKVGLEYEYVWNTSIYYLLYISYHIFFIYGSSAYNTAELALYASYGYFLRFLTPPTSILIYIYKHTRNIRTYKHTSTGTDRTRTVYDSLS